MTNLGRLLLLVTVAAAAERVDAAIPDKYQTIVDRNAFGLNPPPPPTTEQPAAPPPANVNLTGLATVNGQKRAFFSIQGKDPKEPPQYINLPEGQREGIVEVIKISEEDGEVRIKNSGVDMVVSFKNNKNKPGPGNPGMAPQPMPMPNPGQQPGQVSTVYNPASNPSVVAGYRPPSPQPAPTGGMPQPGQPGNPVEPAANTPPPVPEGIRTIPTRTLRLPSASPAGTPQSGLPAQATSGVVYSPPNAVPALTFPGQDYGNQNNNNQNNSAPGGSQVVYQPPQAPITPEQQYFNMLVQKEVADRNNFPLPPVPPMPR